MQKVLTAAEMREVDRLTTERYGIPSIILMENAAHAVAKVITEKLGGSVEGKSILILCGKGNNGGDGAAIGRLLARDGAQIHAILYSRIEETKGDARINFDQLRKISDSDDYCVSFVEAPEYWEVWEALNAVRVEGLDCILDAVFGTGLTRFDDAINEIIGGSAETFHIAVDIPSGLMADSPIAADHQYKADITVTFTAPKPASVLPPASRFNGELTVANIGSPQELIDKQPSQLYVAERSDVAEWFEKTKFSNDSYKNKRGHALIVAGSENYSGAAVLCGNSAIRSGVGLVTVATPRSSKESIAGRVVPEVMVRPVAETESGAVSAEAIEEVEGFLKNVDAIAIGAGLSASDGSTGQFVRQFYQSRKMPTILDADALTLLSPFDSLPPTPKDAPPLIVTPHEGEFMRMLGTDDKEVIRDRVAAVREFSRKHNVILVLKGERVLIGNPDGRVDVNPTGNSGLGKAGNGDTLLGILTGFVAQAAKMGIDIFETVVAAVYVAGMAGDIAEQKYGKRVMTASDVRECLSEVFAALEGPAALKRNEQF